MLLRAELTKLELYTSSPPQSIAGDLFLFALTINKTEPTIPRPPCQFYKQGFTERKQIDLGRFSGFSMKLVFLSPPYIV